MPGAAMNLRAILSADMPTLRRWLAQGWEWWTGQLLAMAPGKGLSGRHRGVTIEPDADDPSGWRVAGSGDSAGLMTRRQRGNVLVAIDPAALLCRTIDVPVLGRGELRQMLAFDIDRLGPIPQEDACFDFEVLERGEDRPSVRVGMIQRARVIGWVDALRAIDIVPVRIALREDDGLHFDLLRAAGFASGGSGTWRWWVAVGLLFALNLGALVWRDVALLAATEAAVEEQAPAGRTALMIRQRLEKEQQKRAWIVRSRTERDPLSVIGAVSAALPPGSWVQRFEFRERQVRLVGFAPGGADVAEALRQSPMLRAVTENDAEGAPPAAADQMQAFDIGATFVPGVAP